MYLYDKKHCYCLTSEYPGIKFFGYMQIDVLNKIKKLTGHFENPEHVGIFVYENEAWRYENENVKEFIDYVINELATMGYEI